MQDQVNYYNHFAETYKQDIVSCSDPHIWTTDYHQHGPVYKQMSERLAKQEELILTWFDKKFTVLDIGCGFGRQAFLLAKLGYDVVGIDTSDVFIKIASELFQKHQYHGKFLCGNILDKEFFVEEKFKQVVLFDVLEHIFPSRRKEMIKRISGFCRADAILIISLPHIKQRWSSKLNNTIRRRITQNFSFFIKREEHPYPIPNQNEMKKLLKDFFLVKDFSQTSDTDYYVLERMQ